MTPRLVVDASVAIKWLLAEPGADRAIGLIAAGHELYAPDLLISEIGNVMWKRSRSGVIGESAAQTLMSEFQRIRLHRVDSRDLAGQALALACRHERSFYDGLYLALAEAIDGTLVTADARFAHALAGTAHAGRIALLDAFSP